jgi:hypothetical protein
MNRWHLVFVFSILALAGCSRSQKARVIAEYPLNSMDNVISSDNITFDKDISSDGRGSLRIEASNPMTAPLFNITNINISKSRLTFSARVRTQHVIGQVYLEMYCYLPGRTHLESRGQATLQSGTDNWKDQQTSLDFFNQAKPDSVKIGLTINGTGTAWIDDIILSSVPLPQ